jgi:two-component system autoinducer 1 sensor kinase/phosphatase LuxN
MPTKLQAGSASGLDGLNVLVVEPNAEIREMITVFLETLGCNVLSESDDRNIVGLVARLPINLLVIEPRIPGNRHGLDAIRRVKELEPKLPVIIVTGDKGDEELRDHPADAVLEKPFDMGLLTGLARHFQARRNDDAQ